MSVASLLIVVFGSVPSLSAQPVSDNEHPDIRLFLDAGFQAGDRANEALGEIAAGWRDSYASLVWDLAWLPRPPSRGFQRFFTLVGFLDDQTGQGFGPDLARWGEWVWNQPYEPHSDYVYLKVRRWQIEEAALVLENNLSIQRVRVPAQRAFWFGWHAQFPDTVLID